MTILETTLPVLKDHSMNKSISQPFSQYLQACAPLIEDGNWHDVLELCHKFLLELPLSLNDGDKRSEANFYFRKVATAMLANQHN